MALAEIGLPCSDGELPVSTKCCIKCGTGKPFAAFTKDRNRKDGLYPVCKECRKPLQAKYLKASANKPKKHVDEKTCNMCKKTKPISGFVKLRSSPDGYYHYCKECHNGKSQLLRYRVAYGFTKEQAEQFAENNVGNCKICGTNGKLVVDHCHESGKIRGFVCSGCNVALGFMKDNPETFLAAAKYLKESQEK